MASEVGSYFERDNAGLRLIGMAAAAKSSKCRVCHGKGPTGRERRYFIAQLHATGESKFRLPR